MSNLERFLQRQHQTWATSLLPVEKQMLVAMALLAMLAPLVFPEFATNRALHAEPLAAFALGFVLGAMTGMIFVVRQRWRG